MPQPLPAADKLHLPGRDPGTRPDCGVWVKGQPMPKGIITKCWMWEHMDGTRITTIVYRFNLMSIRVVTDAYTKEEQAGARTIVPATVDVWAYSHWSRVFEDYPVKLPPPASPNLDERLTPEQAWGDVLLDVAEMVDRVVQPPAPDVLYGQVPPFAPVYVINPPADPLMQERPLSPEELRHLAEQVRHWPPGTVSPAAGARPLSPTETIGPGLRQPSPRNRQEAGNGQTHLEGFDPDFDPRAE